MSVTTSQAADKKAAAISARGRIRSQSDDAACKEAESWLSRLGVSFPLLPCSWQLTRLGGTGTAMVAPSSQTR